MALPPGLSGPVEVALARSVERLPAPGALLRYEPKWDGFRITIVRDDAAARLWSRRGTDLTPVFPEISAAAEAQLAPGTVLDGELVIWDEGRLAFPLLQMRMARGPRSAHVLARQHPASLAAFDLLAEDDVDLRDHPFDERREHLEQLAASWAPPLNLSFITSDAAVAAEWFRSYTAVGIEGLMIKSGADPYPAGGARRWLKVKARRAHDVVCAAVIGSVRAPQQVVAGLPVDGVLRIVGRTGPLGPTARASLVPWLVPAAGEHPWPVRVRSTTFGRFSGPRADIDLTRVEPLVVEVSADAAWDSTSFRHPLRFIRARPDLRPDDVRPPTS
ncbi:ATP-dependent DNA ligase [Promicromonospora sp. NFX87]|uniref:ATP-dependent DNA ligase n=1 Tax=Promicromonospora sp. NFX87 TaxID=3402691 RepID=UPI003AFAB4E5